MNLGLGHTVTPQRGWDIWDMPVQQQCLLRGLETPTETQHIRQLQRRIEDLEIENAQLRRQLDVTRRDFAHEIADLQDIVKQALVNEKAREARCQHSPSCAQLWQAPPPPPVSPSVSVNCVDQIMSGSGEWMARDDLQVSVLGGGVVNVGGQGLFSELQHIDDSPSSESLHPPPPPPPPPPRAFGSTSSSAASPARSLTPRKASTVADFLERHLNIDTATTTTSFGLQDVARRRPRRRGRRGGRKHGGGKKDLQPEEDAEEEDTDDD